MLFFQNDADIEEFKSKNIPTLELKGYIDENIFAKYEKLLSETQFIPCKKNFSADKIPSNFHEETLLKKFNEKSLEFEQSPKINFGLC